MYKVYSDEYLLFDTTIENLKIYSPKLDLELNKTGSFSFSVHTNHPYFDMIKKLKSIITVYQDGFLIFRGRVLNIENGFYNQKIIDCEGELAFLIDSIQNPYEFTGSITDYLTMLLASHNSQVDTAHQFKLGNVTVTDNNDYIVRSNIDHVTVWDEINKKLIENLGGYLWVRHEADGNYLDYLADFNLLSSQKIEFSKNLVDLKRYEKGEDIATVLIPLGAKLKDAEGNDTDERLTISSVNGGKDYLEDTEAISKYGRITKVQIWDDVTEASNLLTKGNAYLSGLVNPDGTIELTAADLATVNTDFTSIHLGTYVPVISKPHGINQNFLVSKLSIDLLNPVANKLSLGGVVESFTGKTASAIVNIKDGKDGDSGTSSFLHIRYSANADGSNMTETPQSDTAYIGTAVTTSEIAPTSVSAYDWVKARGEDGKDGSDGENGSDGKGIASITEYYLATSASSGVKTSTSGWTTSVQTVTATKKYLWNYEVISYTTGSPTTTTPVIIGVYGDKGSDGADGRGITSITEYYLATASATGVETSTSGWTTSVQNITEDKRYLWNYEVITYTTGNPTTTTPAIIGVYGQKGADGQDGKDAAIQSDTAPADTSRMWLDTSVDPPLLRRYNSTTNEWEAINDTSAINSSIVALEEHLYAEIAQTEESITSKVAQQYYLKEDAEKLASDISTQFTQTSESFEMKFNQFNADLEGLANGTDAEFEQIRKYIRFVNGKILLGEVGNQLELEISNNMISFIQSGVPVAWFTDNKLYVKDGEFTNSLRLGNFSYLPRSNGNLSFKKI